jgi:hypothetical protein
MCEAKSLPVVEVVASAGASLPGRADVEYHAPVGELWGRASPKQLKRGRDENRRWYRWFELLLRRPSGERIAASRELMPRTSKMSAKSDAAISS